MSAESRSKGPDDIGIASASFHIASLCVGIPALIWALHTLYRRHKNGGRVSVCMVFLLLNVVLQSAFSPPVIKECLNIPCSSKACYWTAKLFEMVEPCGLHLHQLVALESILSLRHPLYTTDLFSRPCSVSLCVGLYVLACMSFLIQKEFAFCLTSVPILMVTIVFTFKAPPSHHVPNTNRKPRCWVLAFAMVTIALYLPNLLTTFTLNYRFFIYNYFVYENFKYLMAIIKVAFSVRCLRVIADSLLCVLVCKKILPIQPDQTHAEPSAPHNLPLNQGLN